MKPITAPHVQAPREAGFLSALWRPFGFVVHAIWLPLRPILGAVWQLLVWLLYLPLETVLRLTPVGALIQRFTGCADPLPRLERQARAIVDRLAGDQDAVDPETALLVRGERRAYAERIASPAKHPTLYMSVPDDMRRSIVQDGKLVNDEAPAPRLAGATLTPEFVQQAWTGSVRIATKAAYLALVASLVLAAAASIVAGQLSAARERATASAELRAPAASRTRVATAPATGRASCRPH